MKNLKRTLPFIPILGIFLTTYYHFTEGGTGLENGYVSIGTSILQGASVCGLIIYLGMI